MTRTLIELLHIAVGLVGTAFIAAAATWGVPVAEDSIWTVAYVAMAVVVFMGVKPLRLAWRADQAARGRSRSDG